MGKILNNIYNKKINFKVIFCALACLSVLNLSISLYGWHTIFLCENQILYIYSVIAQVVGALLGICIAGYTLMDSRVSAAVMEAADESSVDLKIEVRNNQFIALCLLTVVSILVIILSLICMCIYPNDGRMFDFLSNETVILFLIVVVILIKFILCLSPSALANESNKVKKEIEGEYDNVTQADKLGDFIICFSKMENIIKSTACLLEKKEHGYVDTKMTLVNATDILFWNKVIDAKVKKIINDIRIYRNALIHGNDTNKEVNLEIYIKLKKLCDLLEALISVSDDDISINDDVYIELEEFVKNNLLTNKEKKIVEYVKSGGDIRQLNMSKNELNKRIYNLQMLEVIDRNDIGNIHGFLF